VLIVRVLVGGPRDAGLEQPRLLTVNQALTYSLRWPCCHACSAVQVEPTPIKPLTWNGLRLC